MKRILLASLMAAAVTFSLPANASTPQQDLHSYLARKVAMSIDCPRMPANNSYCHPPPITGSAKDARLALSYMRNVDILMGPCIAGDANSCFRQDQFVKAARKLGWCHKTGPNSEFANNVLWAPCSNKVIVINQPE